MNATTRSVLVAGLLVGGALATAARWLPTELKEDAPRTAKRRLVAAKGRRTPMAPAARLATGEAGTSAEEAFEELAAEVLYTLPTLADLRGLRPDEAHFTPESLLEAGSRLGEIRVELEQDPSLNEAGQRFYRTCALRDDLPASIRGVCYSHYEGELAVPEEVESVADESLYEE